jgi:WXG100 family type VII secretion target
MGYGDQVGGRTSAMSAQAQQFISQADQFTSQLATITSAVSALESEFYGNGSVAYQHAMQKWNHDAKVIVGDLEALSHQLTGSSQALTTLDSDLARAFNGFGG